MSVAELKELIYQLVDETDDEALLLEALRALKANNNVVTEPDVKYANDTDFDEAFDSDGELMATMQNGELVFTQKGLESIEQADAEVERGEFYTHEEAMEMLRSRSYRVL